MIEYPISLCLDEPTFAISACPIVAAEYVVIEADALTWDDPAYEVELTTGHPLRHELPEVNGLEAGTEYTWRARLKDGDDVWSPHSEETATFTHAFSDSESRICLDCTRSINSADLITAKFGEQETDTSTICLKAGTPGATSISVSIYRTTIATDNTSSEDLLGAFSLQYPSGAGSAFAMTYKLLNNRVYVLYVNNFSSASYDSEVIYCYVDLSAPTVVADSMRVVADTALHKIRKELGLVFMGGQEFIGFVHVDDTQADVSIRSYSLNQGTWSGAAYPPTYDPDVDILPAYKSYEGLTYLTSLVHDTVFSYKGQAGTSIVHAVQDRSDSMVVLYRFDVQSGAWRETNYINQNPPAAGNHPVFVDSLPGDAIIRVLLAHYTPGTGAEVLSLSFNRMTLDRIQSQIISYRNQATEGDLQPYISSLLNAGNGYALMVRTTLGSGYMEIESFTYNQSTGELTAYDDCVSRTLIFTAAVSTTGAVSGLGLAANLNLKFHDNTKILAPLVEDPAGDYYMDGEYVRGGLIDLSQSLPALLNREYGLLIGTASGATLLSAGAKGNLSNDTVDLTVTEDCQLTGLKVSATFDRSAGTVWASSAWIYIQELDYAFPLIMGDETYTPWPITITDLEVSIGSQFRAELEASDVLTFEVFQSGSIGTITYSSLSVEAYTKASPSTIVDDEDVEECEVEDISPPADGAIDLFLTDQSHTSGGATEDFKYYVPPEESILAIRGLWINGNDGYITVEDETIILENTDGQTPTALFSYADPAPGYVDFTGIASITIPILSITGNPDQLDLTIWGSGGFFDKKIYRTSSPTVGTLVVDITDLSSWITAHEVIKISIGNFSFTPNPGNITLGPITYLNAV